MASTKRPNTMTDYIASLNAPISATEAPVADFDDANLFATTDFFNFDFADGSNVEPVVEDTTNSKFQTWNDSTNTDFLPTDFQFNPVTGLPDSTAYSIDLDSTSGVKRKHSEIIDSSLPIEEQSRIAAEEDKRRRNTAASARFRVKKKQREQALEKNAKDMTDKANRLEKRVNELEMENRWLKGLITDKNESDGDKLSQMFAKLKEEVGEKGLTELAARLNES